jgi:hypothetical protein
MTVATDHRVDVPSLLQNLIDSRLDTIDRMLLGRVARGERMAIVREVESQIQELLLERETGELSREDVLAVLARLDPPEAFLPEEFEGDEHVVVRGPGRQPERSERQKHHGVARTSGFLGLAALSSVMLLLVSYLVAMAFHSDVPLVVGAAFSLPCMFVCGVLGIALGIYARRGGAWAVVGLVAGIVTVPFSLLIGVVLALSL